MSGQSILHLCVLTDSKPSKVNRAPAPSIVVRISKEPFLNGLRSRSPFPLFGTDSSAGVDPLAWSQTKVHQSSSWSILTSPSKQSCAGNKMRDVIWVYWPQKNISEDLLRREHEAGNVRKGCLLLSVSLSKCVSRFGVGPRQTHTRQSVWAWLQYSDIWSSQHTFLWNQFQGNFLGIAAASGGWTASKSILFN